MRILLSCSHTDGWRYSGSGAHACDAILSTLNWEYLKPDVEGRVSCSGQADSPVDLLCRQCLHSQRVQSPRSVGCEDFKWFLSSKLRERGPQQVHEVCLLQAKRTLQLLHRTFLKHWNINIHRKPSSFSRIKFLLPLHVILQIQCINSFINQS